MTDLIERLRDAAADAAAEGYGVSGLLTEAAAALEAALEDAARYRWLKDHDNAFLLSEDVIDDQIAIDQARGKAGQEVGK